MINYFNARLMNIDVSLDEHGNMLVKNIDALTDEQLEYFLLNKYKIFYDLIKLRIADEKRFLFNLSGISNTLNFEFNEEGE